MIHKPSYTNPTRSLFIVINGVKLTWAITPVTHVIFGHVFLGHFQELQIFIGPKILPLKAMGGMVSSGGPVYTAYLMVRASQRFILSKFSWNI